MLDWVLNTLLHTTKRRILVQKTRSQELYGITGMNNFAKFTGKYLCRITSGQSLLKICSQNTDFLDSQKISFLENLFYETRVNFFRNEKIIQNNYFNKFQKAHRKTPAMESSFYQGCRCRCRDIRIPFAWMHLWV